MVILGNTNPTKGTRIVGRKSADMENLQNVILYTSCYQEDQNL
jgi:hypothetical protein